MNKLIKGISRRSFIAFTAVLLSMGLASCGILSEPSVGTSTTMPNASTSAGTEDNLTSSDNTNDSTAGSEGELELTLAELAEYDGKDGNPAYVAVDGLIYDFSDLDLWADGEHQGQHTAGQDLTDAIDDESPHGRAVLDRAPVVGRLIDP